MAKVEAGTVNSQSDADWAGFAALEAAEMSYDGLARKTSEKLVSGGTAHALVQYSYDAKGRLECTAQRMNPAAFGSLPGSACTPGAEGGSGPDRIAKTVWDSADQATQVLTAVGTADEAAEASTSYSANGEVQSLISQLRRADLQVRARAGGGRAADRI